MVYVTHIPLTELRKSNQTRNYITLFCFSSLNILHIILNQIIYVVLNFDDKYSTRYTQNQTNKKEYPRTTREEIYHN